MQRLKIRAGLSVGGLAILFFAGCGSETKPTIDVGPTATVTGTVEMDGKPVANATVYFRPDGQKAFSGAIGITDASGKYELKTDLGEGKTQKGCPLGAYHITISKFVKEDGTSPPPNSTDPNDMLGAHESIPLAYTTPNEEMTFEVTASTTPLVYDIKIPGK